MKDSHTNDPGDAHHKQQSNSSFQPMPEIDGDS